MQSSIEGLELLKKTWFVGENMMFVKGPLIMNYKVMMTGKRSTKVTING